MEELLPLIIGGIVWLAYNFYGKGQKKQNARKYQPASEDAKANKEPSILEQILMGQEVKVPEPEPYYEETEEEVEPEIIPDAKTKFENRFNKAFLSNELSKVRGEGQHALGYQTAENEREVTLFEEEDAESVFDEEFDIKKAIIYEAVLNPPYIDFK